VGTQPQQNRRRERTQKKRKKKVKVQKKKKEAAARRPGHLEDYVRDGPQKRPRTALLFYLHNNSPNTTTAQAASIINRE
jgi:hypothetical protein